MAKRRLGRGLDSLLPPVQASSASVSAKANMSAHIEELLPNRQQPRRRFQDEALQELANSIATHGILEPILVRRAQRDKQQNGHPHKQARYEIIAGERRWRAAQQAGLKEVPIFVRDLSDETAFEAALVENLQREELNPIETAFAFQRLVEDFGHSQQQIAERIGKNRATISNALRLLKLPEDVLAMIAEGQLSEGHGRALLTAVDTAAMQRLARNAVAKRWSVRETEKRARNSNQRQHQANTNANTATTSQQTTASKSVNVRALERTLSHTLGAPVTVEEKKHGKGAVHIAYANYDELDRLIALFNVSNLSDSRTCE